MSYVPTYFKCPFPPDYASDILTREGAKTEIVHMFLYAISIINKTFYTRPEKEIMIDGKTSTQPSRFENYK